MAQPTIIDHRCYTIRPRGMAEFLKIFEEYGLPVQLRHLGPPVGYYQSEIGPLNQVVHLWGYDSLADMEAKRNARNADPEWKTYQEKSAGFVVEQETRIIRRVAFKSLG